MLTCLSLLGHLMPTSRQSPPLRCQGKSLMNSVSLTTTAGRWARVHTCRALTTLRCNVSRPISRKMTQSLTRESLHQSENRRKEDPPPQSARTYRPRPHTYRPRPLSTGRPTGRPTGGKPVAPPRHPVGLQTPPPPRAPPPVPALS